MMLDLALRGGTVVLPDGAVRADIGISGESISMISASELPEARRSIDVAGK
jgi:dihydroorotase-like cyclic amidohydrolase